MHVILLFTFHEICIHFFRKLHAACVQRTVLLRKAQKEAGKTGGGIITRGVFFRVPPWRMRIIVVAFDCNIPEMTIKIFSACEIV